MNITTGRREQETPERVERTRGTPVFVPEVDIIETEGAFLVLADMPGVDANSVDVTLENDVLTIDAHAVASPPPGHRLTMSEFVIGDYRRSFSLTDRLDRDGIRATVRNGVLRLHLPKAAEARTRKIAVRSEA